MFNNANPRRPPSENSVPGEDIPIGGFTENFTGKNDYQDLIRRANAAPIIQVLRHYNVKVSTGIKLITCPFKFHKGGRERTPSFECYPHTNTFYCHGCSTGTKAVDFVSKMDNLSRRDAALKIIKLFESDIEENDLFEVPNESERLIIMTDFSNLIREFRASNSDEKGQKFIEHICEVYDSLNDKHNFNNESLLSTIAKLKLIIKEYSPHYTL